MISKDGQLRSRTASTSSRPGWPAGLRPLLGGALLLVPEQAEPEELLVFFHGANSGTAGGLALMKDVAAARRLLVLLPNSTSTTWNLVRGRTGPDVAGLDARLAEVMAAYDVRRVALAGFSDGGSYALSLGLANGDLVEEVLAFSPGFLAPPGRIERPHVWVSHGRADAVLPVDVAGAPWSRNCGQQAMSLSMWSSTAGTSSRRSWFCPVCRPGSAAEHGRPTGLLMGLGQLRRTAPRVLRRAGQK